MTLEDICKEEKVRGRLNKVAKKLASLEFLLECKEVELTLFKRDSRIYAEIQNEIQIIQIKLDELRREDLLAIAPGKIPKEKIV